MKLLCLFLIFGCSFAVSSAFWWLRSSNNNAEIANRNYPNSGIQRWVATKWGDEIPNMRDDLIRRKDNGQGAIRRHLGAWTTRNNWNVDWNNDRKELADPYRG